MRYLLALVLLLALSSEATAQFQGMVVQSCGTLPQAYAPGSTRLPAIDINGNLCSSGASPPAGQLPGTATNDNASAGNVGEVIESIIASGTTQSLTSNTGLNITSISLTAGDWDVRATAVFACAATTTVSAFTTGISTVSATLQNVPVSRVMQITYANGSAVHATVTSSYFPVGPTRLSLATTTTVYLIAIANFGTSTCSTSGGHLAARRMR